MITYLTCSVENVSPFSLLALGQLRRNVMGNVLYPTEQNKEINVANYPRGDGLQYSTLVLWLYRSPLKGSQD